MKPIKRRISGAAKPDYSYQPLQLGNPPRNPYRPDATEVPKPKNPPRRRVKGF